MDTLSSTFSALSDPTRRTIIDRLARGPACVGDIAAPFSISLNAVSKHLKVLEHAGLIRRTRRGRSYVLQLEGRPLREVARWAQVYQRFWSDQLERLETLFKDKGRRS
jgi:DNA-binding transcriptional ArsR family regulator